MKSMNFFKQEDRKPEYYLLNKDKIIASFYVNDILQTANVVKHYEELPKHYGKTEIFIRNRRAPKHRENINELLKISGCDDFRGFLNISHALSLIDTFWVKPIDSDLTWDKVSLFTHPFNEVIAKTAFEGGLHGKNFSTTSPEYGTDGSFAKCWIREGEHFPGDIKMLKRGASGFANFGLEPYSEYYASQLVSKFTDNYVNYDLRSVGGRICSVCDIFTSEKYGFVPYAAIDTSNAYGIDTLLETADKFGILGEIRTMIVADAVIMNEDRHKNNFGFFVDNDTLDLVSFAPLFDHNLSLLARTMKDDFKDLTKILENKGPRLYDDWFNVAAYVMDSRMRKILINLLDFKFTRHSKYNLPEWRLEALEKIIHQNIEKILSIRI